MQLAGKLLHIWIYYIIYNAVIYLCFIIIMRMGGESCGKVAAFTSNRRITEHTLLHTRHGVPLLVIIA